MKPTLLKPGQRVIVAGAFDSPVEMVFLRRLRPGFEIQLGQGAECLFQCEAFRGLNGPDDPGRCTMTDARVVRDVGPA
jgi:hypothetical protein